MSGLKRYTSSFFLVLASCYLVRPALSIISVGVCHPLHSYVFIYILLHCCMYWRSGLWDFSQLAFCHHLITTVQS